MESASANDSSVDRLRLEIMASMQTATTSQATDRHLFTADDALDGRILDDEEEDYEEIVRSITVQHGGGLQLKTASLRKGKSGQAPERLDRLSETKFSALRDNTSLVMQDLMDRKLLDQVHERIYSSHNAHIYYATATDCDGKTLEYAVKIFRNAKSRQLKMRAKREYDCLLRAFGCGACVSKPVLCEEHILVMKFKGSYGTPARPLALGLEYESYSAEYHYFGHYKKALGSLRRLYQAARLVHGTISERGFMCHDHGRHPSWASCWLAGLGHAVDRDHPDHMKLLAQDVACVQAVFAKLGLGQATDKKTGLLSDDAALDFVTLEDPTQSLAKYYFTWREWRYA